MKKNDTLPTQLPAAPPCAYLSIPLEVAQDHVLSDGAMLLFGELYGLCRAYDQCFASDAHFQSRRGKGRSTIQRQISELSERGYMYVVEGDKGRRELRVAERYFGGKDRAGVPENETQEGRCPKIEKNVASPRPVFGTHKTPESENKHQEERTTPSLSSGVAFSLKLAPEQEERVRATVCTLGDGRNAAVYASLLLQATERGRLDAWDVALASTKCARLKSGNMQKAPIAYFRKVLTESWLLDRDFLRDQGRRRDEALAEADVPRATFPPIKSLAEILGEDDDDLEDYDAEESEDEIHGRARHAAPVGEARSLSAFPAAHPSTTLVPVDAASVYDRVVSSLPAIRRDAILAQAKAQVRQQYGMCSSREDKPGILRLIANVCQKLLAQEAG